MLTTAAGGDSNLLIMESFLDELGWSKSDLAERVGVHKTTVSRWGCAPGPVMAYLELAVKVKRLV